MKLTKFEHACIVLEEHHKKLIIDPGDSTPDFGSLEGVIAVVVTHVHPDHFFPESLQKIIDANTNVKIFTTSEVTNQWNDSHAVAVKKGDEHSIGSFKLKFFGELHNAVHSDWPRCQNTGVLVNDTFYYGGDSLDIPETRVDVLAVPVAYTWLKIGEAIDYIKAVKPRLFFKTHDRPLSEAGIETANNVFAKTSEKYGHEYRVLKPGDSIEI